MWTITVTLVSLGDGQPVQLTGDYQVLQRNEVNTAACVIPLSSAMASADDLMLHITDGDATVYEGPIELADPIEEPGVMISDIPVGGPYTIRISGAGETVQFNQVFVGDLWVLAGQSNMQGSAPLKVIHDPVPGIHMLNMDNTWKPGTPPLHRLFESDAEIVHQLLQHRSGFNREQLPPIREESQNGPGVGGVGCGFFFARVLLGQTDVPIGFIPCAYGGTSLEEWSPDRSDGSDNSLYGHMINRIKRAGGTVRGMLWYQGESDAGPEDPTVYGTYFERFQSFFEAVRRDCDDPDLPIFTAQIGRVVVSPDDAGYRWEAIREAQRRAATEIPHVHMVATVDLPLSDGIHISYDGQEQLGERMAWLARPYVDPSVAPRKGIALESVRFANADRTIIHVDFANVTGQLSAAGLARGFGLSNGEDDRPLDRFYHVDFDTDHPNRVVLHRGAPIPESARLWHAPDLNPVANIVDENDMPVPAFGPVTIDIPR